MGTEAGRVRPGAGLGGEAGTSDTGGRESYRPLVLQDSGILGSMSSPGLPTPGTGDTVAGLQRASTQTPPSIHAQWCLLRCRVLEQGKEKGLALPLLL